MPNWVSLSEPVVGGFGSVEALAESLDRKYTATPGDGLYPRDGSDGVAAIEELISEVTIPGQENNVIWASGMAAVMGTVNFVAHRDLRYRGKNPVIAFSTDLYPQSTGFFRDEMRKGVTAFSFNAGDRSSVEGAMEASDVLFAETVANSPDMPVLDIIHMLEIARDMDKPPILVLDNTLPLSTGVNFGDLLRPEDPVIVVESGTKNLMNNSESLGVSYSLNQDLIRILRQQKARSGSINSIGALDSIHGTLLAAIPEFHDRNRSVFSSTGKIALALQNAADVLGEDTDFQIIFPQYNSEHPNSELARQMTSGNTGFNFPSPVAFIIDKSDKNEEGGIRLARRIARHPAMREQFEEGQVDFGQSFGLPGARILFDLATKNVRFAGGFNLSDEDALAAAIGEAAADK